MSVFKGIGILVFLYTFYCLFTGEVYVKDKASGRTVCKADEPGYYWAIIVISLLLCFLHPQY